MGLVIKYLFIFNVLCDVSESGYGVLLQVCVRSLALIIRRMILDPCRWDGNQ